FPKGRLQVGEFYSQLRDWPDALEQFQEGARLNPNPSDNLLYEKGIVNVLLAQGKQEDASKRLDSLVTRHPKDLEIKAVQASVWTLSRQPAQIKAAIGQLEDLRKQKPNDIGLRYGLAYAYRGAQNWASARSEFQEIMKRQDGRLEARLGDAEMTRMQGNPGEALAYADQILATGGEEHRARLLRSAALISMRSYGEAQKELNRILKVFPRDQDAQVQTGVLALLEKRYKDAETIF